MHLSVRRPATLLLAVLLTATAGALVATNASAGSPSRASISEREHGEKSDHYQHWATITRIPMGYYYDAGQQNTHLVVTRVKGGLRYADRRTDVLWGKLPDSCDRKHAEVGLVVVCHVPRDVSARNPMRVKVFTRLGNDHVNTSKLPKAFRLYGLADQGNDTYIGGRGNDFVNGAPGGDYVSGGAGNDVLRGGDNHDVVYGGPGDDHLVGLDGPDRLYGSLGDDRVGGHEGDDLLFAGPGDDFMLCSTGRDRVEAERKDRIMADCEHVERVNYS